MVRARLLALVLTLAAASCWPGRLTRVDGGDEGDLGPTEAFAGLAPCFTEDLYLEGPAAITFGGVVGRAYTPRCLTVHTGAIVTFTGTFATHPLRASTRGAQPSPIPATSSGGSLSVTLATRGYYPFYCGEHGDNSGSGMAGVIRVIP